MKRIEILSLFLLFFLGVGFLIRSGSASLDPPNRVWWADCQSDGLIKACRQGGNQINLTIEYSGFLLKAGSGNSLQVFLKLNGRQSVFSMPLGRMDSAQLFLASRYSSCRRGQGAQLVCVEAPSEVQSFLTEALRDGENHSWQLEVFFVEPSTGRRDDNSGRNYFFELNHRFE